MYVFHGSWLLENHSLPGWLPLRHFLRCLIPWFVRLPDVQDPDDMLSISSDIEDLKLLRSEVCRIPRKYNSTGRIQIMTKKEMQKLKIQSPNVADSLMMSLVVPEFVDDSALKFDTIY